MENGTDPHQCHTELLLQSRVLVLFTAFRNFLFFCCKNGSKSLRFSTTEIRYSIYDDNTNIIFKTVYFTNNNIFYMT